MNQCCYVGTYVSSYQTVMKCKRLYQPEVECGSRNYNIIIIVRQRYIR